MACSLKAAYDSECKEVVKAFEKSILLHVIDEAWKENLRELDETWVSLRKRSGFLSIKGKESLCSTHHQSMIARRQQDFNFTATTRLEFQPDTFQQMAGLAYYYNTRHFYYLFMSWEESLNSYVLNIFVNDDNRWDLMQTIL